VVWYALTGMFDVPSALLWLKLSNNREAVIKLSNLSTLRASSIKLQASKEGSRQGL